jgi:hypothetical protein
LDTVMLAIPLANCTLPIGPPPSRNVTVPVALDGVTVALSVTGCPNVAEGGVTASVVVLAAVFTPWLSTLDVLPATLLSPL